MVFKWKHKIAAENIDQAKKYLKKKAYQIITHQDNDVLRYLVFISIMAFFNFRLAKNNELLKKFYPTNVLVTGFDIIFFWVARMIMMGLFFMKKIPFKSIYIHPLVKMKKVKKCLNQKVM